MASKIFAIVADHVQDTGRVSFTFMGVCQELLNDGSGITNHFGLVTLKGNVWKIDIGRGSNWTLSAQGTIRELRDALRNARDCVLLMDTSTFRSFRTHCQDEGIELRSYYHHGTLSTS